MQNQPQLHPDVLGTISNLYGVIFPPSIQPTVAQYIRAQLRTVPFNEQLPEPIVEQVAITLFTEFIAELERITPTLPPGDQVQLSTAVATLRQLNPLQLYLTLIKQLQPAEPPPPSIEQQTDVLHQMVLQCETKIGSIAQMTPTQREPMVTELTRDLWVIVERATGLVNQIIGTYLRQWRINQNRHGLDEADLATMLNRIQRSCEVLAAVVWSVSDLIRAISVLGVPVDLIALAERTKDMLAMLATKCFIVEKQPPRVVKTNAKFSIGIRHLLGEQLYSRMVGIKLQIWLVSEAQARITQQSNVATNKNSGALTFDNDVLELDKESHHLKATFGNLQVKKIQRQERRGADAVTDEKFAFLFDLSFSVGDLAFSIWTISQPVVVIVHGNQETAAKATILWDNAFADPSRIPFEISERIAWNLLAEMLNQKLKSMDLTRPLSTENLHYLGVKATRRDLPFPVPDTELVTRAQFCRDLIPSRKFTFWEWFYAAIKVTKDSLKDIWNEGLMIGFIDKVRAEQNLGQHPPGTFLLRFSDSQLGGITIAYVTIDPSCRIQHINPFIGKDAVNVVDTIRDLPQLKFLYPRIPKADAFGRHFHPKLLPVDGYVTAEPAEPPAYESESNQLVDSTMLEAVLSGFEPIDHTQQNLMEL